MKERILYKINCFIITLIFCLAIFIPFSMSIFEKDKEISEIEKRKLSKVPETPKTINEIKELPKLFDKYYSDHFGFKDWFVKYYKLVKYGMGDSPSEDVTIGRNGWLFLGSIKKNYTKYNDPIGDVRNINLYSQKELKKLAEHMTGLELWLNGQGIEYVFVIAPNKHTIYFDQLPDYIAKENKKSSTDQLVEYLKKHTTIEVVDLRDALISEKDKHELYYKTGTHWNFMGGNIAQYEIMKVIQNKFPEKISPQLYKNSIFQFDIATDKGLENMSGIIIKPMAYAPYPVFEPNAKQISDYPPKKSTHTIVNLNQELNAVIFRDSFFMVLEPYFTRKFKRSTYIWSKSNQELLKKYIELENPDVIIEEWVERSLPYVPRISHERNKSLYKKIFNNSDELIFSNDWRNIKLNNCPIEKNAYLRIKSNDTCPVPIIRLPLLPIESNKKYILHIKMTSSVQSKLKVFYSNTKQSGHPFSEKNSILYSVNKGDNDIYISLDYQYLGKHLRLDPIYNLGEVTIQTLEIKKVAD